MTYLGNEETLVEKPAVEYIITKLGYDYAHGDQLIPDQGERDFMSDVILGKRLRSSLKRINSWMNEGNLNKAMAHLTSADILGTNILEINEKLHDAVVNLNYSLDQDLDASGHKKYHTVKYIDWDNIDNNEFLVTRQFKVHGPNEKIIPDIVIFLNGIPVVVMECKSPFLETVTNEKVGKYEAYNQLRRYMDAREASTVEGAPRLFHTNFFTVILNKYHAYAGTISSQYMHYLEWKDPYPFRADQIGNAQDNGQNLLLHGMFEKRNLLDILRNFLLFETEKESGIRVKKIVRYQQYRAVNKALDRLAIGTDKLSRGGVVWHTQGSGKSLTMVFLARKIRTIPELQDSTIVVVSDRIDLDKQIYETFVRTLAHITTPVRAQSVAELKSLLTHAHPQIITTTIQKFQGETEEEVLMDNFTGSSLKLEKAFPILTTKSNVIVLADEAHRSQYKSMAKNMRDALPNAAFIGFTGTPIEKEDKNIRRTFGEYIDKYSIQQSVDDEATVAIIYEGRMPELQIKADNLEELFDSVFEGKTDAEKEALKKKYVNKLAMVEADDRIDQVAQDILRHYKEQIYPNEFKAQIVCVSRIACVKYYNALNKHMERIVGEPLEAKIIYSGSPNDIPFLKDHFTTKAEQDLLIKRFIKPLDKDKLAFLIVKDMLLTGFDAPVEQVMYMDRPLKEHALLQAIARVNRTCGDNKKCGYVVDYFGVSNFLQEALAIFDEGDLGTPLHSMDEIYKLMLTFREEALRVFNGTDRNDLDALVNKLEPQDKRDKFELDYRRFAACIEQILPSHVPIENINDLRWMNYIRAAAKARFAPETELDISGCGQKVKQIISDHLTALGIKDWIAPIEISDPDFKKKIRSLGPEGEVQALVNTSKHIIHIKMDDNPVFYTSLLEKLQKILDDTKNDWVLRKKMLEEFLETEVKEGETVQAESIGLDTKVYSFYEVIKNKLLEPEHTAPGKAAEGPGEYLIDSDKQLAKQIAIDVTNVVIDKYVIDWTTNPTKTGDIERAILMMLTTKYFKQLTMDKRKQMVQPLLQLAKKHYAVLN